MFKNLKITFKMASPIAAIHPLQLDGILVAACTKEQLGDDYKNGLNKCPSEEEINELLSPILDMKYGVYCASWGFGRYREFVGSWAKRWDSKNDDIVKFAEKKRQRIDIGCGTFKNYHMPIIIKSYPEITFYARGDIEKIQYFLQKYIHFVGKKSAQGYGEIREMIFEEIESDLSVLSDFTPMRNIPVSQIEDIEKFLETGKVQFANMPIFPPYWRRDHIEKCIIPAI